MSSEHRTYTLLHILINRFHPGGAAVLAPYLFEEEAKVFEAHQTTANDWAEATGFGDKSLQQVHYSHLAPAVLKLDPKWQPYALAALPTSVSIGCQRLLGQTAVEPAPNRFIASVLRQKVQSTFQNESNHKSLSTLELSELASKLMSLSKKELVQLVDLFAMQDVAEDIRNIVDKAKLKKVYHELSQAQQDYLKVCLHQVDRLPAPKIGLENWDGDSDKLAKLLHRRGLSRLAKALFDVSADEVWHISCKFDTGRSKALAKYIPEEQAATVTESLQKHLSKLLDFMANRGDKTA